MERQFIKYLITNKNNFGKKKIKPTGIVLHETATPNAPARQEVDAFNSHDWKASAHAFIDWNEDIQSLEWNQHGYHACEPANSKLIGLEMCCPKINDPKRLDKMKIVYNSTVNAFARLFFYVIKEDKVTKDNCMSHDEVRLKWQNTSHTDPTQYLKEIGYDMNKFRSDVQRELDKLQPINQTKPKPLSVKPTEPQKPIPIIILSPIDILFNNKIISDITFWKSNAQKGRLVDCNSVKWLFRNFYKYMTKTDGDYLTSVNYCLSIGVLNDKSYWIDSCNRGQTTANGEYVEIVIDRMASKLK